MSYDAVIIGSGPNGLAAAALLCRAGKRVHVVEGQSTLGGGMRSAELTLPGFVHDVCSAVHPMGALSPFFRELSLDRYGAKFIHSPISAAHPLDDEPAVMLQRSLEETAAGLGQDGHVYQSLMKRLLKGDSQKLAADMLAPLRFPRRPITMARLGFYGMHPAQRLAWGLFEQQRAKALLAGCAAHSVMSFDKWLSGAVGLVFAWTAHVIDWPVIEGGSQRLADALVAFIREKGGTFETDRRIQAMADLPEARAYFFDSSPKQLCEIAGDALPQKYRARLSRYRYGPGVFKIDYALSEPIPWRDPQCLQASTVHLGGTLAEIADSEGAAFRGEVHERPFVLLAQQSQFDSTRAPDGRHTGYAYCHVPHGCTVDMTQRLEAQIERFAPGFRDCVLARHTQLPADFEHYNPAYVGGAVTGGVADLFQFFTRPVARLNPYSTPNPKIFICSAATPPGGGVHGMCGYHAAARAFPEALNGFQKF